MTTDNDISTPAAPSRPPAWRRIGLDLADAQAQGGERYARALEEAAEAVERERKRVIAREEVGGG